MLQEKDALEKADQFINEHKTEVKQRWYPLYHVAAPFGWINDPNGFCRYKDEYHLFYQFHPYDTNWGPMHWGHVKSEDLVRWVDEPVAMAPTEAYEANGCFSGSAIEKDGNMYLFYTGNAERQTQCLAISDDGQTFFKYAKNPIITVPQREDVNQVDFRDPKVWKYGDKYYCVVGSKTPDDRGQVLLYESEDLKEWTFKNVMARGEGNQGLMWECPNFATIDGQDVLICSPQDVKPEGRRFLNKYQSVYMLGKLDYETGIFEHNTFEMLDYGFDFYAPQVTQSINGRCIMIAWLAMWQNEMPEREDGWATMMTIPRELHFRNGRLVVVPATEVTWLRKDKVAYANLKVRKPTKLDKVFGRTGELLVDIDLKASKSFQIKFRASENEETVFSYDAATCNVVLDREKSGVGPKGSREVTLPPSDKMSLRVYLDRSSIEIFINEGEYVFSARIYPDPESTDIIFVPQGGGLKLDSVEFYKLDSGFIR